MTQEYTLEEYLQAHANNQLPPEVVVGNEANLLLYSGPGQTISSWVGDLASENEHFITPYSASLNNLLQNDFHSVQQSLGQFDTLQDEVYFNKLHEYRRFQPTIHHTGILHNHPHAETNYKEISLENVYNALQTNQLTVLDTRAVPAGQLRNLLDAKDMRLARR